MADQHETVLECEYAAIVEQVRQFLQNKFDLEVLERTASGYPPYPNRWRAVWQVSVEVSSHDQRILIAVPKTFPDCLPVVYLPHELQESGRTIPHLNKEREFCTFDKSEIRLNADNPEGIVLRVIQRAQKLLGEGVTGFNRTDYRDEFEAYWGLTTAAQSLSLVGPSEGEARTIFVLTLNPIWKDWSFLFTEDDAVGRRWLVSAGYKNRPLIDRSLYLPLKSIGLPPYPQTNGALYDRLKDEDPEALRQLLDFLTGRTRATAVLFSVPAGNKRVLGAWWHPKVVRSHNRRVSKNKKSSTKDDNPGTRSLSEPQLILENRKGKLLCANVERVDHKRLFVRTTGDPPAIFTNAVNVIGCGSIGSLSAARLIDSGSVMKLCLIDPERLSVENVARHYCGMSDLGEFKTGATAAKIKRHFPQIVCETRETEVLDLMRTSPGSLEPASFSLIAVGEFSVERRLNRLAMAQTEHVVPQCYVWVEPHLYGGHALLVKKGKGGCFECAFDEMFLFKRRVIQDPEGFSMREAGCRSTYLPYSGLYAHQFVTAMIDFLLGAINSSENMIFSWTGDLETARHNGVTLSKEWTTAPSFSSFTRKIDTSSICPTCHP